MAFISGNNSATNTLAGVGTGVVSSNLPSTALQAGHAYALACACGCGQTLMATGPMVQPAYIPGHGPNGLIAGSHTHGMSAPNRDYFDEYSRALSPLGLIAARLGVTHNLTRPFEYLAAHKSEGKVFVFVVSKGQSVTIEDGDLFPSDALITQLRLLMMEA